MQLTLYTADCTGNAKNCQYPNKVEVRSARELQDAVSMDHVCAAYEGNYRGVDHFISSNVVVMDCDNDNSENPEEWITPDRLEEIFADVAYGLAPSRHNMIPKDGKTARPKFHVYFETEEIRDAVIGPVEDTGKAADQTSQIAEGSRNNTMSRFAGRVLKKYGITDKAKEAFDLHAKRCDPPLSEEELKTIWYSAVKFYKKTICSQPGYVAPDEYNAEFRSLRPDDYSDIGEAKALVEEYQREILYTDATQFLTYDGMCWRENRQKAVGVVEEFLDMQLVESKDMLEASIKALLDADEGLDELMVRGGGKSLEKLINSKTMQAYEQYLTAKGYYAFIMKYRNYKHIADTQNTAKPMVAADINLFDAQEHFLNTPEGTFDLRKGANGQMAHQPGDLLTKITNCAPGEQGKQLWEDALQIFFCDNQELIEYVQETVGMAAVGKVYVEALIIAYGEGRNGKSTFWNTISRVMGTYAGAMSADALTAGCRRNVKPEIAELKGKRLIIAAELEEGTRLSTSILKQMCSTDRIRGEKKFKDPFDFTPSHTAVLYTNHLPKVGASDDGTWRRLIVIPFHAKIEGNSDIKNYADYLYNNAGPAIMSWIIEGAKKVIEHEFKVKPPKVVADAIADYRGMNDWLSQFIEECCVLSDGLEQKSGELYQEYRAYCMRTGEYSRNNADFTAEVEKRGFMRKKKKSGMWVQGLQLKDTDFDD